MLNVIRSEISRWVEPVPNGTRAVKSIHESKSARLRAEEEEEKMAKEQQEREQHLQKFQNDVKRRVSTAQRMKRQQEFERGKKEMDIAHIVMRNCVSVGLPNYHQQLDWLRDEQDVQYTGFSEDQGVSSSLSSSTDRLNSLTLHSCDNPTEYRTSERQKPTHDKKSGHAPVRTVCDKIKTSKKEPFVTGGAKRRSKNFCKVVDNTCSGQSKSHMVSLWPPDQSDVMETKQQQTLQRTLSRKVFMDLEREKVREAERQSRIKMESYLLKIMEETTKSICADWSEDRNGVNPSVTAASVGMDSNCSETHSRKLQREMAYARKVQQLQQKLQLKCHQLSIQVPVLCPCDSTDDDTNRNNCANNCMFYRNPSEYCRALKSVLSSLEDCDPPPRTFTT